MTSVTSARFVDQPWTIAANLSTTCGAPLQLPGCFEIIVATNRSVIQRAPQFSCPNRRGFRHHCCNKFIVATNQSL